MSAYKSYRRDLASFDSFASNFFLGVTVLGIAALAAIFLHFI